MSEKIYTIEEIKRMLEDILKDQPVYQVILFGVRIDIWTHLMRECIINYVH